MLPLRSQHSTALLWSTALIFICRWKSSPTRARIARDDLQHEAGAVLERPAVVVGAVVDGGAQELREQVAVGAVQLDAVEACLAGAARAVGERAAPSRWISRDGHPLAREAVKRLAPAGGAERWSVNSMPRTSRCRPP